MKMNQQALSNPEKRWNEIVYDCIDYPSIQVALQNYNQDFVQGLPLLDENFISNILRGIS